MHFVITGVSRGLGRAMTDGFIAAGHTVSGCGRSTAAMHGLTTTYGSPHGFETVDISRPDQIASWAQSVNKNNGPPDFLLNNAALINTNAPLWKIPREQFLQVLEVNVTGTFHTLQAFVPAMIDRGSGVIINFSSTWGRTAAADVAAYCASKFAIEGLTKSLAAELPSGMAAIPLNPGVIDTDMLRTCFGTSAGGYPSPAAWAERAVPFILGLGPAENGKSVTVP